MEPLTHFFLTSPVAVEHRVVYLLNQHTGIRSSTFSIVLTGIEKKEL